MFHPKHAPVIAGIIMGTFMSVIMSAIITGVNTGFTNGYFGRWGGAFFIAWACATPLAIAGSFFVPIIVKKLIKSPEPVINQATQ